MTTSDSERYLARKNFFKQLLTVFGRLPVYEALMVDEAEPVRLHLAKSNKNADILDNIIAIAQKRGAEIVYHDKRELSRISKNAKQDQGVALDIKPAGFREFAATEVLNHSPGEFIALDNITNPQNLGMIIRSVCASNTRGLILPRSGCAKLDGLVIKASAGTLFKASIFRCDSLHEALVDAKNNSCAIVGLDVQATRQLSSFETTGNTIFVLGNESEGLSRNIHQLCTHNVRIPMRNNVESLNVAVTASLIALRHQI